MPRRPTVAAVATWMHQNTPTATTIPNADWTALLRNCASVGRSSTRSMDCQTYT